MTPCYFKGVWSHRFDIYCRISCNMLRTRNEMTEGGKNFLFGIVKEEDRFSCVIDLEN